LFPSFFMKYSHARTRARAHAHTHTQTHTHTRTHARTHARTQGNDQLTRTKLTRAVACAHAQPPSSRASWHPAALRRAAPFPSFNPLKNPPARACKLQRRLARSGSERHGAGVGALVPPRGPSPLWRSGPGPCAAQPSVTSIYLSCPFEPAGGGRQRAGRSGPRGGGGQRVKSLGPETRGAWVCRGYAQLCCSTPWPRVDVSASGS
jgi:hypothetical protein